MSYMRRLNMKCFLCFHLSMSFTILPQITNASLWLTFVINHPSQFSIWLGLLLVQWYTAVVNERRSCHFARFEGKKKPSFLVCWRFPFHPTRGWSLKVISSSLFMPRFALSRTRQRETCNFSSLCSLLSGIILVLKKEIFDKNTALVKSWKRIN